MILSSQFRRALSGADRGGKTPFVDLKRNFDRTYLLVRLFYLLSAYQIYRMGQPLHFQTMQDPALDPRWPIMWIESVPLSLVQIGDILVATCMGFAMLSLWKPGLWISRAGYSLTLLFVLAIPPSMGGTNHGDHAWFWISLVFIFLPSTNTRLGRLMYCQTLAIAQAVLLFFYTLAGFWKVAYGIIAIAQGVEGNLAPRGLAITLSDRIVQSNTEPLLGPLFINNYLLAWPLFLVLIYAQFVAIMVVFRPTLHIPWGLLLMGFHLGTFLLMEINFPNHMLLLLVLLVASPFAKPDWLQWSTISKLPGAALFSWISRIGKPGQRIAAEVNTV